MLTKTERNQWCSSRLIAPDSGLAQALQTIDALGAMQRRCRDEPFVYSDGECPICGCTQTDEGGFEIEIVHEDCALDTLLREVDE